MRMLFGVEPRALMTWLIAISALLSIRIFVRPFPVVSVVALDNIFSSSLIALSSPDSFTGDNRVFGKRKRGTDARAAGCAVVTLRFPAVGD